jgi:hypothetical protein
MLTQTPSGGTGSYFLGMNKNIHTQTIPLSIESHKHYSCPQSNDQDHKIKNLQSAMEEQGIVDIPSEDTPWLKKTIKFNVEETRSRSLDLQTRSRSLDLQTRSKATRQKRRPVKPIEKTPSIAIMKGEEGRSRSSLLLERSSLVFFSLAAPETQTLRL